MPLLVAARLLAVRFASVLLLVASLLAGCGGSGYWYCWDKGDPKPHHLGKKVSGDHPCSQAELDAAGVKDRKR